MDVFVCVCARTSICQFQIWTLCLAFTSCRSFIDYKISCKNISSWIWSNIPIIVKIEKLLRFLEMFCLYTGSNVQISFLNWIPTYFRTINTRVLLIECISEPVYYISSSMFWFWYQFEIDTPSRQMNWSSICCVNHSN